MNITEPIIQAASLGTAHSEYTADNLPETLKELVDKIKSEAEDTESFLYQAIAAAFTYRRAGWKPASAEEKPTFLPFVQYSLSPLLRLSPGLDFGTYHRS